jgi:hypothetical protein
MFRAITVALSVTMLVGCVGCASAKNDNSKNDKEQSNQPSQNSGNQQQGGITSAGDPTTDVIVSGQIFHKRGVPQTLDEDFVFTSNSHAIVKLNLIDESGELIKTIKEIRFSPLRSSQEFFSLPLKFAMHVDSSTRSIAEIFSADKSYALEAIIHSKSGDEIRIGDLVTEVAASISEPTIGMKVEATGVEDCNSVGSNGICSTIK